MQPTRYALIPAYEPDEHLPALVLDLRAAGFEVVVVDDGSGPAYAPIFSQAAQHAALCVHETNLGKGRALKTGFAYIEPIAPPEAAVVTLDSDGQHRPEDVLAVCEAAEKDPGALVLGSRALREGTPLRSRFGNGVTRLVFRLATGRAVHDTQTGLRAFCAADLPYYQQIPGDRYEYEMNVLLACAKGGVPIREVPIRTIYFDRNAGSHFHTLTDSWRVYGGIVKFAASSFTGFLIDYSLYSLLVAVTAGLGALSVPLSNVTARVVSAGANFALNKRFVFHNHDSVVKTAGMYFLLAACILAGNTLLLSFLTGSLGWNKYAAKLLTELTFFTLSWLAQKHLIFRKKGDSSCTPQKDAPHGAFCTRRS